jgi:hypothetical protein
VFPYPGAIPSVSANGTSNAIVWAARRQYTPNACNTPSGVTSALLAYRADTLAVLYDSSTLASDSPGTVVQFTTPTIADGRVFVAGKQTVSVYGILPGCNPITCSTGCCQGTACISATNDATCGTNGATCAACPAGDTCVSGACRPPGYAGFLDSATCTAAAGWAWDGNQPNTPISVDVSVDGHFQATVLANQFRQDLLNAGIGNGDHGYQWSLPASFDDGAAHSVSVTISGTAQALSGSPKSVTCGCGPANCASGCCQSGTCVTATGNSACGTSGAACQVCSAGAACVNNACLTCNATTCPNGCCQSGACVTATGNAACGTSGAACQVCAADAVCVDSTCLTCNATTCPNGCCQNGTCITATGNSACGTNGATCQACALGATCTNNVCLGTGTPCGANFCSPGSYCCNASCGTCAPKGGGCTQQYCPPSE